MTTPTDAWPGVLTTAATATRAAGPAAPAAAAQALQLAWATAAAVHADTADDELWWLRLAETIDKTAYDLGLVPAAPDVQLGTGPSPTNPLPDTPALRSALSALLAAAAAALHGYTSQDLPGADTIAAAVAWRSAHTAASATTTP